MVEEADERSRDLQVSGVGSSNPTSWSGRLSQSPSRLEPLMVRQGYSILRCALGGLPLLEGVPSWKHARRSQCVTSLSLLRSTQSAFSASSS